MRPHRWFGELLRLRLVQPDQRSCGAAVLVLAEAWHRDSYARSLLIGGERGFAREVLSMHRRVTGPVDVAGRAQLPWSRLVGTPPWAVARQLTGRTGVPHRIRPLLPARRARDWRAVRAAVAAGWPVPLYVGSGTMPRHVLLALEAGPGETDPLVVYDPAVGRRRRLGAAELRSGRLSVGWPVPWFAVIPDQPPTRR